MDYSNLHRIPDLRENWLTVAQHVDEAVKELKRELHEAIEERKINLKPLAAEKKRLASKTYALHEKAKELCHNIDENLRVDVENCLQDITNNVQLLEENETSLNALNRIIAIHSEIIKSSENLEKNMFFESWTAVCDARNLIQSCEDLKFITVFVKISAEAEKVGKKLKSAMELCWRECVTFEEIREPKETKISLAVDKRKSKIMQQVIKTVYQIDGENPVEKSIEFVRYKILLPQITSGSTITSEQTNDLARLIVTIDKSSSTPHYLQAFDRITKALDFLHTHINVAIPNQGDLFRVMGQTMAAEITEKLMENCLAQVILDQPGQTETFGDIVSNAEKLEASLKRMGFLSNDVSILMESDVDGSFVTNMIYAMYLEKARSIMKKQTLVGSQMTLRSLSQDTFAGSDFNEEKEFLERCPAELHVNSYCKEILELVDKIVSEVKTGKSYYGMRHLRTICNIFEMFGAIVPLYWKKLFESSSNHVAMFHNSCIYFSHVLLCLADDCKHSWPNDLADHFLRFVDHSRELRLLAKSTLKSSVSKKRGEIIAIVKESGLVTIENHPKLDPATENSVRQSLRQLENFSMSMKILPDKQYINAMGFLVDGFTETLVNLVCKANDISAVAASDLIAVFNIVSDRVPKLFKEPLETVRWCRKWTRFEELKLILGANMETFKDRWASGMGPISYSFSKEEASHLLRALFSNTSARSALLLEMSKSKN